MKKEILLKDFKIIEVINANENELLNLNKEFKIKQIDLLNSLSPVRYSEFIVEKNYLGFQLIYPFFNKKYIYFGKAALFLLKDLIILIHQNDDEINKIKNKTIFLTQKNDKHDPELFIFFFISVIIRRFFPVLKDIGKEINELEKGIKNMIPLEAINKIARTRRNLAFSHTALKSILNSIKYILNSHSSYFKNYLDNWKSSYEKADFILEKLQDYREILEGLNRSFESIISIQINESIKILTFIQSIFLPAMLLSSIYGMNVNLPLQSSKYAFLVISFMMLIFTFLFIKFIKKF